MRCPIRLVVAVWLGSTALGVLGCSGHPFRADAWSWNKKPAPVIPGLKTADERIQELRELAQRAPKMGDLEREQTANGLSKEIQSENDLLVRIEMLKCLAVMPCPMSAAVLRAGLDDKEADVRVVCCQAWGKIGGDEAVAELTRVLNSDTDVDVRLAAASALGVTRVPSATKPLGEALADPNPAMQARAMAGLKQVSGKDFGNNVQAWKQFAAGQPADYQPPTVADRLKRLWK